MNGRIKLLEPDINDKAVDNRGAIFSFVPETAIVEFCYILTKQGSTRGHHFHKEFDEYIMLVDGEGVYLEKINQDATRKIVMGPGQVIFIPSLTPHTFIPLTDCKSISLLTKRWDDCNEPITSV